MGPEAPHLGRDPANSLRSWRGGSQIADDFASVPRPVLVTRPPGNWESRLQRVDDRESMQRTHVRPDRCPLHDHVTSIFA